MPIRFLNPQKTSQMIRSLAINGFGCLVQLLLLIVCNGLLPNSTLAMQDEPLKLSQRLKAESVADLAAAARENGEAVRGAILFPQQKLGCANCHAVGNDQLSGPDLSKLTADATDPYLVESLLSPSAVIKKGFEASIVLTVDGQILSGRIIDNGPQIIQLRDLANSSQLLKIDRSQIEEIKLNPKSGMPDDLIDQLEDRQAFLDLVSYLMQLRDAAATTNLSKTHQGTTRFPKFQLTSQMRGDLLISDLGCASCHTNTTDAQYAHQKKKHAPNLNWSGQGLHPDYIRQFILDPSTTKPGTSMPHLLNGVAVGDRENIATQLTHFVVALGNDSSSTNDPGAEHLDSESAPPQMVDETTTSIQRGQQLFNSVGCVACHNPRDAQAIELPLPDSVPLGTLAAKYKLEKLVTFLEDPLAVRPSGRMPNLNLNHWEAEDVANFLLQAQTPIASNPEFEVDLQLAAAGKRHFVSLGCVGCHGTVQKDLAANSLLPQEQQANARSYPTMQELNLKQGCLSGQPGTWPGYTLSDAQRQDIVAAVSQSQSTLDTQQQVAINLHQLRCLSCHRRQGQGGVADDRDQYFATRDQNLGPQGRIPPNLTNVGAKLNIKWLQQVIVGGRSIRPYLLTRMPKYGADNVGHLVQQFADIDTLSPELELANPSKPYDLKPQDARNLGHQLVGKKGLNCIACHTFQLKPAMTMQGLDLTDMAERLQRPWFQRYMLAPQSINQNTVMPSFWPGGTSIRKDILEGNTDAQIEAIWQWLLEGREARMPEGINRPRMELLATDEAVMLRRSYPGIGKRGIGVGYPAGINIAYDAEQMRMAMLWPGKFIDPAGVWTSQGHGNAQPLARPIQFSPGPDFDSLDSPWLVDDSRPPRHKFKGYTLDDLMRPKFLYQFDSIQIEDYCTDNLIDSELILRRTLTFSSTTQQRQLRFRIATGQDIQRLDDQWFQIDQSLLARVVSNLDAKVVNASETVDTENKNPQEKGTPAGQALIVPLTISNGSTVLVLEYKLRGNR